MIYSDNEGNLDDEMESRRAARQNQRLFENLRLQAEKLTSKKTTRRPSSQQIEIEKKSPSILDLISSSKRTEQVGKDARNLVLRTKNTNGREKTELVVKLYAHHVGLYKCSFSLNYPISKYVKYGIMI